MLGADADGDIAVQIITAQKRCMAVNVAAPEGLQLLNAARVFVQNTGVIHELGQADHPRVVHQRHQIGGHQPGTCGLHMGRGHAGRQLHADVHQRQG